MKMILFFLLAPVFGYSQYFKEPEPEISITRVELKKDTLFVYRHVKHPPHNMAVDRRWQEWNDRVVYVVNERRGAKEIVIVSVERAKIRKVKVDADEEYW